MDHYVSDEEQLETIKRWWKANGGAIIAGIIIGIVAIIAWQYWKSYRDQRAEQASLHYVELSEALRKDELQRAEEIGQQLRDDFSSSVYGMLAALTLAKAAVDKGDSETARLQLQWVVEEGDEEEYKNMARLGLARLALAEERYDDAEAQLDEVDNSAFTAELQELKGDVYVGKRQFDKARSAYQTALDARGGDQYLQMKLDNLPELQDSEG